MGIFKKDTGKVSAGRRNEAVAVSVPAAYAKVEDKVTFIEQQLTSYGVFAGILILQRCG